MRNSRPLDNEIYGLILWPDSENLDPRMVCATCDSFGINGDLHCQGNEDQYIRSNWFTCPRHNLVKTKNEYFILMKHPFGNLNKEQLERKRLEIYNEIDIFFYLKYHVIAGENQRTLVLMENIDLTKTKLLKNSIRVIGYDRGRNRGDDTSLIMQNVPHYSLTPLKPSAYTIKTSKINQVEVSRNGKTTNITGDGLKWVLSDGPNHLDRVFKMAKLREKLKGIFSELFRQNNNYFRNYSCTIRNFETPFSFDLKSKKYGIDFTDLPAFDFSFIHTRKKWGNKTEVEGGFRFWIEGDIKYVEIIEYGRHSCSMTKKIEEFFEIELKKAKLEIIVKKQSWMDNL